MPTPNILLVVTDDQRYDTAVRAFMPKLIQHVGDMGVTFTRAIVPTPLCTPSRISLLTGLRVTHHGITRNLGETFLADGDTLPVRLKAQGYRTGLFGKYVNRYAMLGPPNLMNWYIPPGWDSWNVLVDDHLQYLGYRLLQGQTIVQKSSAPADYSTDVLLGLAKSFIQAAITDGVPFFAMVTPYAPHGAQDFFSATGYATPAPRHRGTYLRTATQPAAGPKSGNPDPPDPENYRSFPLPLYRPPSWAFGTGDTQSLRDFNDGKRQSQLDSLLAVDDLVGDLAALLTANNVVQDTVVAYTSDNGLQWFEHALTGKNLPYEESIRVPLLIRNPAVLGTNSRMEARQIILCDLTATLLAWAGANTANLDGQSFAAALADPNATTRTAVPLEMWDLVTGNLLLRGVRTDDYKYILRATGAEELYDLRTSVAAIDPPEASSDPYEIVNQAGNSSFASVKATLNQQMRDLDAAGLGIQVKVGFFQTTLGAGQQSVTGIGFQPSAILFFLNNLGAPGEGANALLAVGFAIASGTDNQGYVAASHNDNSAAPDNVTGRQLRNDRCIGFVTPGASPSQLFDGSFVSFDADGFTINWNAAPGTGFQLNYVAIGGDYISNVDVTTLTKPTSPGTVSTTIGFSPDVLFFIADNRFGTGTGPLTNSSMMLGWATRADGGHGAVSTTCVAGANPTDTHRLQRSDRCIACVLPNGSGESMRASVQSWDTNGFTLNYDVADGTARNVVCLAIRGGIWRSGVLTQPTSGGPQTQNVTTGGGGAGAALTLFLSTNDTAHASINPDARLTMGAASTRIERSTIWVGNLDNQGTTVARAAYDRSRCLVLRTETAPNTASTENARADYNGSRPGGFFVDGFQLDWEAIDATGRMVLWLALTRP